MQSCREIVLMRYAPPRYLELSWSVRGGVFMVAGMAVPEESFVISFGDVLVSTHSISFSHTFSDGLTLLLGMRVVTLLASCTALLGQRCGRKGPFSVSTE